MTSNDGTVMQEHEGREGRAKSVKFIVDGKEFMSTTSRLTGLQIKALAGVNASYGLFLEGHSHHGSDRSIGDADIVNLEGHGEEVFYTAPPANYGSGAEFPAR